MLVLTRKQNESIVVGDVVVTVLGVQGGRVRLGIEAPRECSVRRAELMPLAQQIEIRNQADAVMVDHVWQQIEGSMA